MSDTADPAGKWVLDGARVRDALEKVAARTGHDLRMTNLIAVRVSGYTQIRVDVQDPGDHETVQEYGVDGNGSVSGPTHVTSLPLLDSGSSRITAAMVDRKVFDLSSLPAPADFSRGQALARQRTNIREADVTYWSMNAYSGTLRLMLGVESPYGKAIVEIDRRGRVVQVLG